jgi:hypothetical protein
LSGTHPLLGLVNVERQTMLLVTGSRTASTALLKLPMIVSLSA